MDYALPTTHEAIALSVVPAFEIHENARPLRSLLAIDPHHKKEVWVTTHIVVVRVRVSFGSIGVVMLVVQGMLDPPILSLDRTPATVGHWRRSEGRRRSRASTRVI